MLKLGLPTESAVDYDDDGPYEPADLVQASRLLDHLVWSYRRPSIERLVPS